MSPDLSVADLSRVIQRIEEKSRLRPAASRRASLEDVLGGDVEETESGRVFVVRQRFDGRASSRRRAARPGCRARSREHEPPHAATGSPPPAGGRLLYLDTETTGLAGGTGTYVFLVGVGFFDGDAFEVRQYFMRDLDEEPALLAAVGGLLDQFDGVVTYNGGGFDLPLLETRFVLGAPALPRATSFTWTSWARRGGSGAHGSPTAAWGRSSDTCSASPEMTTCPGR